MGNKAIFLDRDGTINIDRHYLHTVEEFSFLPGALEALQMLQKLGYLLVILTNQSGIGRGYYDPADYEALTQWMLDTLASQGISIARVYHCPHGPEENCQCRKPKLGLFYRAVEALSIDLSKSYAIGDRLRDCALCESTPCRGFLIGETEPPELRFQAEAGAYPNIRYSADLLACAKEISKEDTL